MGELHERRSTWGVRRWSSNRVSLTISRPSSSAWSQASAASSGLVTNQRTGSDIRQLGHHRRATSYGTRVANCGGGTTQQIVVQTRDDQDGHGRYELNGPPQIR